VHSIAFDNSYARELEGFYVPWKPAIYPAPAMLRFNEALAAELGLDVARLQSEEGTRILSGGELPGGAQPLAQAYAGHQFGGFAPQLGDGRALLLGEVIDIHGRRRDIAFKGSGRTPFSRGGDGKAAVGPVLREYLVGEAMHALGIPTTRALAAVATGESILREGGPLPGAVLTRVAASHVRVGTFEYFSCRGDTARVRTLARYVIARHMPSLAGDPDPGLALLREVAERQAWLVARWMLVGFLHGVMNTDNMAVSGETIDYGPCAFLEAYDPQAVFSSIDRKGRYAFGNQPAIAQWNLGRLAEALLPILEGEPESAVARADAVLDAFPAMFGDHMLAGLRAKLGLADAREGDGALASAWLDLLETFAVDHTIAWRLLADAAQGDARALTALFPSAQAPAPWLEAWRRRCAEEGGDSVARAQAMRRVNPVYIPRNHLVEGALDAASARGDYTAFDRLLCAITSPFEERPGLEDLAQPAPAGFTDGYRTFCGT
jgi:uncharacterized protein YdiU (UPF0061 family)